MQRFTKFTETPNVGPVVKGLLKLFIAVLLFIYSAPSPDFEPGPLGQLGLLVAGALAVDALLSPSLNKQTSFAAAALKLLVSCAKYLLALLFVLVSTKNLIAAHTADMSMVIALPLLVLSLWKLTEHWHEWQRQWVQQKNQLPAPWQSKHREKPRAVPAPLTIPEQVQTPQTIPVPTLPERRATGRSSVARCYKSPLIFLLWLLMLPMWPLSLVFLFYLLLGLMFFGGLATGNIFGLLQLNEYSFIAVSMVLLELVITVAVIDGCRRRIWRQWRYGYDADSDKFFIDSGFVFGSLQRKESWPAADFTAIYWQKYGRDKARLWLKSGDNYEDVLLADLKLWYSSNERFAQRLAEELSAASALPLINRLPRS